MVYQLPDRITVENANTVLAQLLSQQNGAQNGAQAAQSEAAQSTPVDLSGLTHCDSAGIAVLIAAKAHFRGQNKSLDFVNPSPQVIGLAKFLKTERLLFG
ncbi:STAS domain-containing protein [Ostreibacterium oceani]|uniref:STAS domain-containing protein n=1 Tax=Ostreibacterium oceani TaxID=2654998 RepID=A0A6N7F1M0_9GAMM|nr:STAS domain-containing protein [Ostreibacterium oceani]MPV86688.1 STAS domain-containing protein [Ostreibacterium oceani]